MSNSWLKIIRRRWIIVLVCLLVTLVMITLIAHVMELESLSQKADSTTLKVNYIRGSGEVVATNDYPIKSAEQLDDSQLIKLVS